MLKKYSLLLLILGAGILNTPLKVAAQSNNDTANFPTELPPEDADIIERSELDDLLKEDGARVANVQEDERVRNERLKEDLNLISTTFQRNRDLVRRFPSFDGNAPGLRPSGDGNYLSEVSGPNDTKLPVVTMGPELLVSALASSLREFPKLENQVALYRELYRLGQINEVPGIIPQRYPNPRRLSRFGPRLVGEFNNRISRRLLTIIDKVKLRPLTQPSCEEEIGVDEDRDRTGSGCDQKPLGIMRNRNFPLKSSLTCVRNQANRGTCVAFAIAAGMETAIAKKYKRWVNLSEQDLYYRGASLWQPRVFGDGLWPWGVMDRARSSNYPFPYEEQWDYNTSNFRSIVTDPAPAYVNSCDGYTGSENLYCSNTAGQGRRFCFPSPLSWLCLSLPAPADALSPYKLNNIVELWDVNNTSLSFTKLILTLALAQRPVVLSIPVHTSWDRPDANGYVQGSGLPVCAPQNGQCIVRPGCECNRGGHAVLAVGFINNGNLPAGAPPGDGGGYIIIKNSWSTCYADGGYVYVPYQWIRNLTGSAISVLGISN
jgi:hypothetical protein